MAFIEPEYIYALIEGLLVRVWKMALNLEVKTPFLRMSFNEAMTRFGSDKPDMRYGLELTDLTTILAPRAAEFLKKSPTEVKNFKFFAVKGNGLQKLQKKQEELLQQEAKKGGAKVISLFYSLEMDFLKGEMDYFFFFRAVGYPNSKTMTLMAISAKSLVQKRKPR
jgi:aspartyl-tRNA synthetase